MLLPNLEKHPERSLQKTQGARKKQPSKREKPKVPEGERCTYAECPAERNMYEIAGNHDENGNRVHYGCLREIRRREHVQAPVTPLGDEGGNGHNVKEVRNLDDLRYIDDVGEYVFDMTHAEVREMYENGTSEPAPKPLPELEPHTSYTLDEAKAWAAPHTSSGNTTPDGGSACSQSNASDSG